MAVAIAWRVRVVVVALGRVVRNVLLLGQLGECVVLAAEPDDGLAGPFAEGRDERRRQATAAPLDRETALAQELRLGPRRAPLLQRGFGILPDAVVQAGDRALVVVYPREGGVLGGAVLGESAGRLVAAGIRLRLLVRGERGGRGQRRVGGEDAGAYTRSCCPGEYLTSADGVRLEMVRITHRGSSQDASLPCTSSPVDNRKSTV